MNRTFQLFGKYFFYLLLSVSMAACGSDEEDPAPTVTADFSFAADANTPGKVNFTNNASNATTYLWDFGDGATSVLASPSHTYSSNGTFEVTLTASSSGEASGKLPGKTGGSGKSATKTVTVSNAVVVPSMTANMQGAGTFTYTAAPNSVVAWRTSTSIIVRGASTAGVIMEIAIPANAVAGGTYTVSPQQPNPNTSISYTNSTSTWNASTTSCGGPATGTIKVNSLSATSISGTYTGSIYNITCSGGSYSILSASFTAKF